MVPRGAFAREAGAKAIRSFPLKDVRQEQLAEDPRPQLYLPLAQSPDNGLAVVVRGSGDPAQLTGVLRREIHAVDAGLAVANVRTMRAVVENAAARPRFVALLLGGVAARPAAPIFVNSVAVPLGPLQRSRLLGDAIGRRRMFAVGLVGFTVSSLLCGIAPNIAFGMGQLGLHPILVGAVGNRRVVVLDRVGVGNGQRRGAAGACAHAVGGRGARHDDQKVGAEALDLRLDRGVGAFADRDHRDQRGDSDEDAEHRQRGAHFVAGERAAGDQAAAAAVKNVKFQ